jgi:hypothetical protein
VLVNVSSGLLEGLTFEEEEEETDNSTKKQQREERINTNNLKRH